MCFLKVGFKRLHACLNLIPKQSMNNIILFSDLKCTMEENSKEPDEEDTVLSEPKIICGRKNFLMFYSNFRNKKKSKALCIKTRIQ